MMVFNKINDVSADRIARMPHRGVAIEAGHLQRIRAFDRPFPPSDGAGKYRARPFLGPVAKSDYIVESFAEVWINRFGPRR